MVAKHGGDEEVEQKGLNLAKIHMVAKLPYWSYSTSNCLNLAKIHMVAKPQTDFIT